MTQYSRLGLPTWALTLFLHPSYQPGAQEQPWAAFQTHSDGGIYLQLEKTDSHRNRLYLLCGKLKTGKYKNNMMEEGW